MSTSRENPLLGVDSTTMSGVSTTDASGESYAIGGLTEHHFGLGQDQEDGFGGHDSPFTEPRHFASGFGKTSGSGVRVTTTAIVPGAAASAFAGGSCPAPFADLGHGKRGTSSCSRSSITVLPQELVEDILKRLRPNEPTSLFRAAAVCKSWRRIVTDSKFFGWYSDHHGAPPMLGFFYREAHKVNTSFMPSTVNGVHLPDILGVSVHDVRHGFVLLSGPCDLKVIVYDMSSHTLEVLLTPEAHRQRLKALLPCSESVLTLVAADVAGLGFVTVHGSLLLQWTMAAADPGAPWIPGRSVNLLKLPGIWGFSPHAIGYYDLEGVVLVRTDAGVFAVEADQEAREATIITNDKRARDITAAFQSMPFRSSTSVLAF
uniref:F-box domain-containing protein n=1 Tax=Oryza punctata TaxID=4537 RepID=A0A0E0LGJ2_ORYPU